MNIFLMDCWKDAIDSSLKKCKGIARGFLPCILVYDWLNRDQHPFFSVLKSAGLAIFLVKIIPAHICLVTDDVQEKE
jgi:hypothetical protein